MQVGRFAVVITTLAVVLSVSALFQDRPAAAVGAGQDGSGLLLANEATEPGVHIVASRRATSLTVQRGERRHVITPDR